MQAAVERLRAKNFSLEKDEFDQEVFAGRLLKFVNQVDPRTLLPKYFFGISVDEAQDMLEKFKSREVGYEQPSDDELWKARKIVRSTLHPDSGEAILPPFRMSGFVPFGTPIVVGMLLAQTPAQNVFWQWANQSHNAAVNYSNRNMSAPSSTKDIATSYTVAVSSAITVSLIMDRVVKRLRAPVLQRFVPFIAVASANILNVGFMRRMELESGITVFDEVGKELGQSVMAAKKALAETAVTRVVLPVPILVLSPLLLMATEKLIPAVKQKPGLRIAAQATLVSCCFMLGLPLSLSLFRERGTLAISDLEPELRAKCPSPQGEVYYSKGL
ncbi:Sideroflexin-5 [Hondaea fermentalgiana]|uniref:Sideroflexin-5 n=1 Tax=Hondaea fermentalgiana TaxID=2315210 RepID=A0A2R5GA66_9STRA|nr:Sideroflexin-5 [Hondaea fermentalgiana]|eukprot:GBG27910.1 Sideroflexin-5 [Hondaea fermentalgiana]